ncbi:MAG: V-type ATP synthase subunit E [Nitrososphaerales archaeon]|jgi:V/A-type H+-transporting ATPase subunit E
MSNAMAGTLEKVSGEFESELLGELQKGKRQALSAVESSRREASVAVTKILDASVKQAESLRRQIIGAAELEARNTQLKTLEKAVVEVFDAAVKELEKVSGARYDRSLTQLVKEGLEVIGPRARIYCRPKDREAVSAVLHKLGGSQSKLVLEEKSADTDGGVVVTSMDGSVRFDNTFEARLERMRSVLRMEVSAILTSG